MPALGEAFGQGWVRISPDTSWFREQADADIRKALAGLHPDVKIGADFDSRAMTAAIAELQRRLAQASHGNLGMADLIDVNVPQSKMVQQLLLIKRMIQRTGLADFLGVNLNQPQIMQQLQRIADLTPTIEIGADTGSATAAVEAFRTRIEALSGRLTEMRLGANSTEAEAAITRLQARLLALTKQVASITMKADTSRLDAQIAAEEAKLAGLRQSVTDLVMDADAKAAIAKIALLEKQAADLKGKLRDLTADVDIRAATTKISAIEAELKVLKSDAETVRLAAETGALDAAIIASEAKIATLKHQAEEVRIGGDPAAMIAAQAGLLSLEAATDKLGASIGRANDALVKTNNQWGWWLANLGAAKVSLYGGAAAVGVWHLALDALVETLAILVPAVTVLAAGLGAFAATAVESTRQVITHLKNVGITAEATGETIPPLTSKFDKLADAARPQVFELYGAALNATGGQFGRIGQLAQATGDILNRFAARIIVDLQSGGKGLDEFIAHGKTYLAQLGDIFANIGHFIAYTVRVAEQTGIAEMLLKGLDAASRLLGVLTKIPAPLMAIGLLIHGWYLWGGVLGSISVGLLRIVANMTALFAGTKLAGTAMKDLAAAGVTSPIKRIGAAFSDIATNVSAVPGRIAAAAKAFAGFATSTGGVVTGIALAVAALVGFVVWMAHSKDATDRFIDSMNKLQSNATVFNGINVTATVLYQTTERLAQAQNDLNDKLKAFPGGVNNPATAFDATISRLAGDVDKLRGYLAEQTATLIRQTGVVSKIAGAYGVDLTGAMALASLAGVKWQDLTSSNTKVMATALQQIDNLVTGYKNMGQGIGQLGSDMNALTVAGSNQVKAIENLNTAFDFFIKTVTGPISGFLDLTNSIDRFNTDAGVAGAQMTGLGDGYVTMSKKITTPSLQLQKDFQDVVTQANNMFDAMRATQAPADAQVQAIKLAVAALIPLAGSNKAAAAEISALAQEAGGPATTNLQLLSKWAGAPKDPLDKLQKVSSDAAIGFSNLSEDAKKLATTLQQDLTNAEAKAVEQAVGLQDAMNKYATDVRNSATATAEGRQHRLDLINDLAAMGIKGPAADQVLQSISATLDHQAKGPLPAAQQAFEKFAGQGGKSGLGLSQVQASDLWGFLKNNLQPLMGILTTGTAPQAQAAFERWAGQGGKSGLGLTRAQADALWAYLSNNLIPLINTMTNSTIPNDRAAFEKWAGPGGGSGLGLTKKQADLLYDSLHKIVANGPYNTTVGVQFVGSGTGSIAFKESIPGVTLGPSSSGILGFHAAGGRIPGFAPGVDSRLAAVSPGEFIMVPEAAQAIGYGRLEALNRRYAAGRAGPPPAGRFAAGGVAGIIAQDRADISSGTSFMERTEADFGKTVITAFIQLALQQMKKDIQAAFASQVPNVGSGVERWRGVVDQALRMEGLPVSFDSRVLYQMQTESGGNPNAINLTDINAQRGDPSRGLMQVIMATFRAYHWPGTSWNIYDPLANIAAAINYARHVYGPNLANAYGGIGSGHGYAGGGPILDTFLGTPVRFAAGGTAGGTLTDAANPMNAARNRLLAAAHAESAAFWDLYGTKLPPGPQPTMPQRYATTAWKAALEKQQLATFGMTSGTTGWWGGPPGAFQDVLNALRGGSGTVPWDPFASDLSTLLKEVQGTGIKGGINPPDTPADSGWAVWKYLNPKWKKLLGTVRDVQSRIDAAKPDPPWVPAGFGPAHTVHGSVLTFDKGGYLPPRSLTLAYNGLSRPEPVGTAAGPGSVTVVVENHGVISNQAQMRDWLTHEINNLARTGRLTQAVQRAAGR